jgi:hypothetical protein
LPITVEQIKRGIEILGLVGAQAPNALDWFGKHPFQIFQPGIFHGHEWVLVIPIVVAIGGFAILIGSASALWYLLPAVLLMAAIAGPIWEYERMTHSLSDAVLLVGWTSWSTLLGLVALSIASLIKMLL